MSLEKRLDKIAAKIEASKPQRRQIWRQIIEGEETKEEVLDRMVANGEIAEREREDVSFVVWRIGR